MLRKLLKSGVAIGMSRSGLAARLRVGRSSRELPLIVGYHRVVQDFARSASTAIPSMLISARMLEKQLDWLAAHYRLLSLEEIGKRLEAGASTDRTAAVTFDDGYGDVYENAFPILRRKGIPATIFVVTGMVGTAGLMNHDRLYSLLARALRDAAVPADLLASLHHECGLPAPEPQELERAARATFTALRLFLDTLPRPAILAVIDQLESRLGARDADDDRALTWEMIDTMRSAGVGIGSHSRTHLLLTHEGPERKQDEIAGSRRALEERLKGRVEHFAYPDGRFDTSTVIATAAAGYRFAYTTCAHRDPDHPLLTQPRRILWEQAAVDARGDFSGSVMDCLLGGLFDRLSPCRQEHGAGVAPPAPLGAPLRGTAS